MNLGTNDRKKVGLLAGLGLVAGYLVYSNVLSSPSAGTSPPPRVAASAAASIPGAEQEAPRAPRRAANRNRGDEFHPTLGSKRPEERLDPMKIDPTLRLDLLAKLQGVETSGPGRNLFQFGTAPPKPAALKGPEPKVVPVAVKPAVNNQPAKPPGPAPPPPINLRYYGYSSESGQNVKTAFFLDGEDILVAKEGETLKRRYRVVRIGVNSVVMEDTQSKHEQTLPLAPEAAG